MRFGPDEAEPVHDGHIEDVNGDGVPDLVAHFRTQDTGLSNGDTQATLIGETNGGTALEGSDAVRIPKGRRLSKPVGAVSPSISAGRLTDFLDGDFSAFDSPAVRHVLSMSGNLEFGLYQNYPNPFNPSTTIRYTIVEASDVRLMIYNVLGQPIRVLVNATQGPGAYSVQWDGRDKVGRQLSTGIYLYRLVAGQNVAVRKMVFTK